MNFACLTNTMMGMTYEEVEAAVKANAVVLFPVGVVEAHGPHMPLGTDQFVTMHQAFTIKRCFDEAGRACVIAPPFYFGGTQAMTRQFAGTFTSSLETITAALKDILASLDRFGFGRVVLLNAHGDGLQKKALLRAITESNAELKMRSYWPEYEDDVQQAGFTGEEDFLLKIAPMQLEEFFIVEQWPQDPFDIHAGAFETAQMQDILPELVHTEKLEDLTPTMLKGDERKRWNKGEREDIALVPKAYVGDPAGSKYLHADMDKVFTAYAKSLMELLKA